MSDTPRTDAQPIIAGNKFAGVPMNFARELERENAKLRDDCDRLHFALNALQLELGIDPAISNLDTPTIVAALQHALSALERENAKLRDALTKIRALKPQNMAQDYWSTEYGLRPDDVFDICDDALSPAQKSAGA